MCNGDIYNHASLWETLGDTKQPTTENDCEVLIPLMESNRTHNDIRGVFAAIAWNPSQQRLIVTRDAFGVRPLFFIQNQDEYEIYCSDIRVLGEIHRNTADTEMRHVEIEEV